MAPKAPLEKFYGQPAKNGYLKIVQRGDPLGRQAIEFLRGRGGGLNPLLRLNILAKKVFKVTNKANYLSMSTVRKRVLQLTLLMITNCNAGEKLLVTERGKKTNYATKVPGKPKMLVIQYFKNEKILT